MKKQHITILLLFSLVAFGCSVKQETATEEVPTTLEQHDSGAVTSSSSYNSGTGGTSSSSASATGGAAKGSGPTSFAFSTNSMYSDTLNLTDIRDIAENRELREYLQTEAIKLLLEDGLIDSKDEKVSLSITHEWVMVNEKLISESQAQKYVDLLKSKMSMGEVFNYSFNQY